MTIKAEAFIALEESLTERLASTFEALVSEMLPVIERKIEDKDWDAARTLVRRLDLSPVYELNKPYIRYVSHMAMLFGASRIIDDPTIGMVGLGHHKASVGTLMDSFARTINVGVQQEIQDAAMQLIARKEDPTPQNVAPYLATILKAAKPSAALPFASFMKSKGRTLFNIASSLHTSRLASFGFTAEAETLGITRYAISEQLDGRTCNVCAYMHGKTFEVADARGLLDVVTRTQDPDELKFLQPWPSQSKAGMEELKSMNREQLVQNGWHIPPFHPRCRGMLVRVGKVPALDPSGQAQGEVPDYQASPADFEQLGVKFNQSQIDLWNQLVRTAPSEVIARLLGMPLGEAMAHLATGAEAKSLLGLEALKTSKAGINLKLNAPAHGSKEAIKQNLWFRTDKSLFIGSVEFGPKDALAFKPVMKSLYSVARTSKLDAMVATGESASAHALAKYGFLPNASGWSSIRKGVAKAAAKMNLKATEKKALDAILASEDPANLFALADLPSGPSLLKAVAYSGALDFSSAESVARFLSHFG